MIRILSCLLVLLTLPAWGQEGTFSQVTGPCGLEFPHDHGAHRGYRTEWWYYTGNLAAGDGRRFGFQFTIFRRQLAPTQESAPLTGGPRSAWRTDQVYIGHAAVSDIGRKKHYQGESISREMDMLAGVSHKGDLTRVFLKRWEAVIGPAGHRLTAQGSDFSYRLELTPAKPPVRHGEDGYSRKGLTAERASCYYSFTRLKVSGELRVPGETLSVNGLGWMDQEFSSAYLEPGLAGWDWFSLQFSDGTELMIFLLRRAEGGLSPASSATFVDGEGHSRHLGRGDLSLTVEETWKSPASGAVYPIRWKIRVHSLDLQLALRAAFFDQEMDTENTTGVTYWEGAVNVSGHRKGRPLTGRGYLEMTGRSGKGFEAPL